MGFVNPVPPYEAWAMHPSQTQARVAAGCVGGAGGVFFLLPPCLQSHLGQMRLEAVGAVGKKAGRKKTSSTFSYMASWHMSGG